MPVVHFHHYTDPQRDPHFLVATSGELLAANRAGEKLLGLRRDRSPGTLLRNHVDTRPEEVADFLRLCARSQQPLPGALALRCADGELFRGVCHGYGIDDLTHGGRLVVLHCQSRESASSRFLALNANLEELRRAYHQLKNQAAQLSREIAERRHAEKALQKSKDLLTAIIDGATDNIFLKDTAGRYLLANNAIAARFGQPKEAIIGRNDTAFFTPEDAARLMAWDREIMTAGTTANQEVILTEQGSKRHWLVTKGVLRDHTGQVAGVWGISRDITTLREQEQERLQWEKRLQHMQKLESLGVLAGGIAHDFNNLLMAILGYADLALLETSPLSNSRRYVEEIEKAARRAADLAGQMLAYSGKGKFVIKTFSLSELVKEMGKMLEISVSKKAILKYRLAENLPPIEADPTQIRQVVMNLVINASEAIGEKSGVITVTTGALDCNRDYLTATFLDEQQPEGLYSYLEVADTGCGMDPEIQAKLFDPFFTTKFTGRGLGMASVLGIVRGHKGSIKVYSEAGQGTTIKVLFPVSSKPPESLAAGAQPTLAHHGATILLVDDDETVRAVGKDMLTRLGHTVFTAVDGRDCLEVYSKEREAIDCIVLDLTMPRLNGEEAFRELRQLDPEVRVILSSGYNEEEIRQRFAGKGIAGFIQKPYALATLKAVLAAALDHKTATDG